MFGRRSRRPAWALLLLATCLVALGFHFVGECLTHTDAPTADSPHSAYDLAEDQFVLNLASAPSSGPRALWGAPPLLQPASLRAFGPPVPPPDL